MMDDGVPLVDWQLMQQDFIDHYKDLAKDFVNLSDYVSLTIEFNEKTRNFINKITSDVEYEIDDRTR